MASLLQKLDAVLQIAESQSAPESTSFRLSAFALIFSILSLVFCSFAFHRKPDDDSKTESESRIDAINSKRIIFDNNPFSAIDTTAPFPKLKNHSLLQAAFGEKPDRIPVWLHRQAGRYMKEFRDIRLKYTFFEICKTPELVAEVTLQPINAFDLDASIVFSDILVIPPILGLNVNMVKGVGPVFQQRLIVDNDDINDKVLDTLSDQQIRQKLSYVYEGITLTRHALKGKVPLIGFVGGPFTLFAYSIEGKSSKNWSTAKKVMYQYPNKSRHILKVFTDATIAHLVGQANAGAQALEIFESAAGQLSPHMFREFVMPCLKRMYVEVKKQIKNAKEVPMILFAREVNLKLDELMDCGYEVYAIGWGKDVIEARKEVGDKATLQGNLDPWCLYGDDEGIKRNIDRMLDEFDVVKYDKKRLIVNLGHGMMPGMRPSAVTTVINSVRSYEKEKCK